MRFIRAFLKTKNDDILKENNWFNVCNIVVNYMFMALFTLVKEIKAYTMPIIAAHPY